jgi:transposase
MQHLSGTSVHRKSRLSKMGDAELRCALYLPAVTAIRYNPCVRNLADRMRERDKCEMTIVGAGMHKLLSLAYGVLKSGVPFDPDYAFSA